MPDHPDNSLKLGKGSYFVKSRLGRLRQEDDIWEADFFPVPQRSLWIGLVINHTDDFVLTQRTINQPPTVNDLARLLADAMQRPLVDFSHRPRTVYFRERPEWSELLPHLKQLGIHAVSQASLPKWDEVFGDLYAKVEGPSTDGSARGRKTGTEPKTPKVHSSRKTPQRTEKEGGRLYTLEVFIIGGPVTEKFAKKNPVVARTIQIRGDQSLKNLHDAIFDAFDRWEQHMYEFQFGKAPMHPKAKRYVLPNALAIQQDQPNPPNPPVGRVDETTIESLKLKVGDRFGYWFDFGDDWWHQINVTAIETTVPKGRFPKITKKVGKSPPQYAEEEE